MRLSLDGNVIRHIEQTVGCRGCNFDVDDVKTHPRWDEDSFVIIRSWRAWHAYLA
jgi:hypothetical protein